MSGGNETFVFVVGPCLLCRVPFSFNPHTVPSLPVKGVREPICRCCITRANKRRVRLGLAPHPIHPTAYEAIPESQL